MNPRHLHQRKVINSLFLNDSNNLLVKYCLYFLIIKTQKKYESSLITAFEKEKKYKILIKFVHLF